MFSAQEKPSECSEAKDVQLRHATTNRQVWGKLDLSLSLCQHVYMQKLTQLDLDAAPLTLVYTDVQGSTRLWEAVPDSMDDAISILNVLSPIPIIFLLQSFTTAFCVIV